jgi:murein DD-endopeptidase MepM/ murein hydrolase activator NlpD
VSHQNIRLGSYIVLIIALVIGGWFYYKYANNSNKVAVTNETSGKTPISPLTPPLDNASGRINKKPFSIKISPNNSPISPERFTGYHTGVDFEILPGEENIDVPVHSACSGTVLYKQWARGYGGLIVQSCDFPSNLTPTVGPITVLYGHLALSSSALKIGDTLAAGQLMANLGQAGSHDTDTERKHLHFGVHKGTAVVTNGYVSTPTQLLNWINPALLLPGGNQYYLVTS